MAVTPTLTGSGRYIYKRTATEAGFFVCFDATSHIKPLQSIHYNDVNTSTEFYILEPTLTHAKIGLYIDPDGDLSDPANKARNEFESFLLHLYAAGVFISSTDEYHDLDADMVEAGITSMYDGVNVLDFLVLTGAKVRNYKQPDGTILDLMTLGPSDTRPNLTDVPDKDISLMKDVIKHIGLKGFAPYLYAAEGIDFSTFAELILFFYPDTTARATYWATPTTGLQAFLASKSVPMLTETQLQQLGLKA